MLNVKALEKAFLPTMEETPLHRIHPIIKIVGLGLMIIASLLTMSIFIEVILLIAILVAILLAKALDRAINLLNALKIPFLIMIILFFVLYLPQKAIIYGLRLLISSFAIVLFFSTTKALDLAQALDNLGLGSKIADIFELSLRLIPLLAKDTVESIEALTLRGVIGSGFRGLVDTLAMLVANSFDRAEKLREALLLKYYGVSKKRTYPYKIEVGISDGFFLLLSIAMLIIAFIC